MAVKLPKRLMHRNLLAELLFFKFGNNFACHDYLCQNFPFAVKTPLFFLFIYLFIFCFEQIDRILYFWETVLFN